MKFQSFAKKQTDQHVLFVPKVNKESARGLKSRIINQPAFLSDMPGRYPCLNGEYIEKNHYRKTPLENWYLVLYHIIDNTVFVDYETDCRQDYGRLLK